MLDKLVKYEFRTTARQLLPLFGGLMLTWGTDALVRLITTQMGMGSRTLLNSLFGFLAAMMTLAVLFMTLFVNIRQFYRLLGEDGYLLFTLPAHPSAHVAAKLLCSTGWFFAFCVLMDLLQRLDSWAQMRAAIEITVPEGGTSFLMKDMPATVGLLGLAVLGIVCMLLFIYLCVLIGSHWPQQRLAATLITYFALSFAIQVGVVALLVAFVNHLMSNVQLPDMLQALAQKITADPVLGRLPVYWYSLGTAALVLLVLDLVLWYIIRYWLTKRLNIA